MPSRSKADFFIWGANNVAHGPFELPALVTWTEQKRVTAETWIFVNTAGAWQRANELSELRMFFPPKVQRIARGLAKSQGVQGFDHRSLRRLRLLADLSDEQLARFVQFVEVQRLPQWSTIVRQGDRGNAMYLVFEGELSVRMRVGGVATVLANLSTGDFFGDLALFDHGPRSADVVADTSVVLLRISYEAFAELVEGAPDLAAPFLLAIGRTFSARIRAGNKHKGEAVKYVRAIE